MSHVWQRHPRYALLVAFVLLGTFLFLNPFSDSSDLSSNPSAFAAYIRDTSLPAKLARAEQVYTKTLKSRQELIHRHGPTAHDILMFPPDRDPWPAYTVWSFFPPTFDCPHETERVGSLGDGGKWTCGLSRLEHKPECVVYSFGTNYDVSFESELLDRTRRCQIYGFDIREAAAFGGALRSSPRAHFMHAGLSSVDKHGPEDVHKLYTLESLMRRNGHAYIDILKVDLEGAEFDVLTRLLAPYLSSGAPLPFGQLLLEIHTWEKTFAEVLSFWETLEGVGLRPFATEVNLVYQNYNRGKDTDLAEYSFLNIKGDSIFVADPPVADADAETRARR
ncbi:hypothetical protein CONPUDRAFT_132617 [Coniophora puteana RWD-64-598 SS2]|uniref:Methyltransferase domain-containing protein n=1 Tax=Coniophora puteana (strain RWD-64-598) TaxID=741705 RepID=A0A5M3M8Q8_CONPW|nr:uncharacterized protein CONPUDRAFT_132617 [Coniophora puteana RWD-64-598 SS2]EIW75021.1 hypothetical protein CONPUDRAFT_132617 [Coniophora puteana RWD-64-598 SS2]